MPCFSLILALIAALYFVPVVQAQGSFAPHGRAGTSTEAVGSPGPPEILNRVAPSIVQVLRAQTGTPEDSNGEGRGSGIAIEGGVISSDHVVGDADQVVLIVRDGRRGSATVVRKSRHCSNSSRYRQP
jgi:S1-C subfamily serine protease